MKKDRNDISVFILSLSALAISTSFFTINYLEKSGIISKESIPFYLMSAGCVGFVFWGWAIGLVTAVVSLVMAHRIQDKIVKVIIWVLSSLAIISAMLWALLIFFLMWMLAGTT